MRTLFLFEVLLFALFLAAGIPALPIGNPDTSLAIVTGIFGAAAMGVQNAQAAWSWRGSCRPRS